MALLGQGHAHSMNTLAYSADGQRVATGGDDAKVKVGHNYMVMALYSYVPI